MDCAVILSELVPYHFGTSDSDVEEHLLACKALFDRPKDWLDIEQMLLTVDDLDARDALRWVERGAGETDHRPNRLRDLIQRDREPEP